MRDRESRYAPFFLLMCVGRDSFPTMLADHRNTAKYMTPGQLCTLRYLFDMYRYDFIASKTPDERLIVEVPVRGKFYIESHLEVKSMCSTFPKKK